MRGPGPSPGQPGPSSGMRPSFTGGLQPGVMTIMLTLIDAHLTDCHLQWSGARTVAEARFTQRRAAAEDLLEKTGSAGFSVLLHCAR